MKKRPNFVVFMTDQQNAQTIQPSHIAKTPNIDAFIEKSMLFDQAYTTSPHCCPSRASFFTGLYPSQHNVWNNVEVDNALSRGLYDGVTCFPEVLKDNGYHNVFAGKWHVSATEGPGDRGFDEVLNEYVSNYGRCKAGNNPVSNDWDQVYNDKENIKLDESKQFGEIVRLGYPKYFQFGIDENPFSDALSVENACKNLDAYDGSDPFFLYVGVTGPHDPYCVPQQFIEMYKDVEITLPPNFDDPMTDKPALYRRTQGCFSLTSEEHRESIRRYLAFVSYEDYQFGKLMQHLKDNDLEKDTYVLFVTDHGDYMGAHGLWAKGLPCFKEAYQICAVFGGGDIEKGSRCKEFVSIADFAPTILELAGIESDLKFTGKSLVSLLQGKSVPNWRTEIYTQTNGNEVYGIQRAVWNKSWKYVFNTFDYDELYDLENDPLEMHNVIGKEENKPIVKELCKKLWTFARDTRDNCTCPYIMVGFSPYGPGIVLEE
jgi:choline-sulfatase